MVAVADVFLCGNALVVLHLCFHVDKFKQLWQDQNKQQMSIILQIGFQPIVYDNMYHFIIAVGLVILNFSKKYDI